MFDFDGGVFWLGLGPAVVGLWAMAGRRVSAMAVVFGYYLGVGRGLIGGGGVFFVEAGTFSWWHGLLLWIGPALFMALVWGAFWHRAERWWRAVVLMVVIVVPPVGIIGIGSPLLAAGVWFPGLGLVGLAMMMVVIGLVVGVVQGRGRGWQRGLAGMVAVGVVCNVVYVNPVLEGWEAVNTSFGDGKRQTSYEGVTKVEGGLYRQTAKVAVWPEMAGGWLDVNADYLTGASDALRRRGAGALMGGYRMRDKMFVNVVESLGVDGGLRWEARVVAPVSMWRPWSSALDQWEMAWVGSGVKRFMGQDVGVLICYEMAIAWPVLLTMFDRPTLLVGMSNGWWAKGTAITGVQEASLGAWGRLMGVPVVSARNE